jgi:transmembrane sensor
MTETEIYEVIARVINGSASLLDHNALKQFRDESEENELIYTSLLKLWDKKNPRVKTESEKVRIENLSAYAKGAGSAGKSKTHHLYIPYGKVLRYAAIVLLLLSFGFLGGLIVNRNPGENGTSEIFVSRGSRANITLPDGSIVWLGHESRLSYPVKFTGSTREVTLSGEAFFDVESDKSHPFLVHTSGPTIRVTGTEFYIGDFAGSPSMEASLVTGRIELILNNRVLSEMTPGTRIFFNRETGKLSAGNFEPAFYEYWKKGEYSFKDKTFGELAQIMKRIYNVDIIFSKDDLSEKRFTGSMGSEDNIYTLLEIFKKSSSTGFNYSIDKNKIYVKAR